MAEVALALLPVLFEGIFKKLRRLIDNELCLLQGGVTEDLEKLEATVRKFQHVLQASEMKEFRTAATKDWHHRLNIVGNEADGILDDALDCLEAYDDGNKQVCHPFTSCFNLNRVSVRRHSLGERIKSITRKFDLLDAERCTLDMEQIDVKRETVSTLSELVIGRDEEKEKIINTLLNNANIQTGGSPYIYAIVGLGGIGKTTLAQFIYNDEKVVENFDTRIWVWVSQSFDVKIVMKKIIDHFEKIEFESLETMHKCLNQLLSEKKFLLVLDDIWNENSGEWNRLKSSLKCGAIGSSIVLTTRGSDVASIAGAHDRHNIVLLPEEQCWSVFKESAFLDANQRNGQLDVIGKQIVKKCGGLPLAAKSLGGSLQLTREVSEWEFVRDSDIWELEGSCDILPALKLSLNRLDSHSRDCFAFSSVFPKGYALDKENLIHLWIANNLVPSRQRMEPEDMGNKIFNELVFKFFLEVSRGCIKMHDLMHDLGRSFRNETFCLEDPNVSAIPPNILYLSINVPGHSTPNNLEIFSRPHPSLRTCIVITPSFAVISKNFDCLRALDLSGIWKVNLPVSVEKIKHLKYLNLSWTNLTHVPDSICSLTKLQTLRLQGCGLLTHLSDGITQLINLRHLDLSGSWRLTHLPVGIAQMTKLRHLDLSGCQNLTQMPNGLSKLVYLRTLGLFIVGQGNGQRITELQGMNQLRGRLEIRGLEHVRDEREAGEAFLKEKNLSFISLIWGEVQESNNSSDSGKGVLEALQPPQLLNEKLFIQGYGGSVFASWMKLLDNLIEVEIRDCNKCEYLPPLGQLPLLKFLTIARMKSLKCIGSEFYGSNNDCGSSEKRAFPSLTFLWVGDMPILEEWHVVEVKDSQQTSPSPCLEVVVLKNCPKLTLVPSFVQTLLIHNCDKVMVRSSSCLTSLRFYGDHIKSVTSFPNGSLQNLDSLKCLIVKSYYELTSLPNVLSKLTSLRKLKILSCPSLQSLPLIWTSLVKVIIKNCHSLKSLSQCLQYQSHLEHLDVISCDQLDFASDDFHNLVSLRCLRVSSLPKLISFPGMQHLHSLETLKIRDCENLKVLSQGLQILTSLQKLQIECCHSDLHLRCKKDKGEYWHLISHIPSLRTDVED